MECSYAKKTKPMEMSCINAMYEKLSEFCLMNNYIVYSVDFTVKKATVYNVEDDYIRIMEFGCYEEGWV